MARTHARIGVVLALVTLAGCLPAADEARCADGSVCGAGTVCAPVGTGCVEPDAIDACVELPDAADCPLDNGGVGQCRARVCTAVRCGDGLVDRAEACDDGNAIDDDACSNACAAARCGDGIVQAGEGCDAGAANADERACTLACTAARCGDGLVQLGVEACDDGNSVDRDACRSTCALPSCGDGVLQAGEACDAGAAGNGDERACTSRCVAASCGDGLLWVAVEACDAGAGNADIGACTNACALATCGDGLVRDGVEACDDGNATSGDGCRGDCGKVERCGDATLDVGEGCDDGGLISHDGCDSRCAAETEAWHLDGVRPTLGVTGRGVVDEATGMFVHVDAGSGLTWGWDGAAWQVLAYGGPRGFALTYDTTNGRVLQFALTLASEVTVWAWDGAGWTALPSGPGGPTYGARAVWDGARQVAVLVSSGGAAWSWSPTSGAWTVLPAAPSRTVASGYYIPSVNSTWSLGYDRARARVVAIQGGWNHYDLGEQRATTSTWDGAAWTTTTTSWPRARANQALVYDLDQEVLLAVAGLDYDGGYYDDDDYTRATIDRWDGASWAAVEDAPWEARHSAEVGFVPQRGELLMLGGERGFSEEGLATVDLWRRDATGWAPATDLPRGTGQFLVAFDHLRDELILWDGGLYGYAAVAPTWAWDGLAWSRRSVDLGPPPRPAGAAAMTFDPRRGGVVLVDGVARLSWLLGDAWQLLGVGEPIEGPARGLTYDPDGARLVLVTASSTWALTAEGAAWSTIGGAPIGLGAGSLGFDLTAGALLFLDAQSGLASTLDGGTWTSTVSPGVGYQVTPSLTRGSLYFLGAGTQAAWERRGDAWNARAPQPVGLVGPLTTAASRDRLLAVGAVGSGLVVMSRQWTSALPDESCALDEDLDGDGAAGCDDLDCWWACTPACTPTLAGCVP